MRLCATAYRPCESMATVTDFGSAVEIESAEGKLTLRLVYLLKVVLTIRKISITSSTSMNAIRLISGTDRRWPLRKFMSLTLAGHGIDETHCLLFHVDHKTVDKRMKMPVKHECRHGHAQSEAGVIERH